MGVQVRKYREFSMAARQFASFPLLLVVVLSAALPAAAQTGNAPSGVYYPQAEWRHKTPAEAGIDAARLKDAIDFAVAAETKAPRDLKLNHYQTFGREPFGYAIGPIKNRGEPTGIVVYKGYVVAEWGEPFRVDMAHSVTKSFLSSVVGIAVDRGMIRSIDDTVRQYVPPIQAYNPVPAANKSDGLGTSDFLYLFDTPHNGTITWDHLLRQTSDWEGTLWGKPDWADRPGDKPAEWTTRARDKPARRTSTTTRARTCLRSPRLVSGAVRCRRC
jgi:CubicO group peptidase (beta-lactamase class C family)